MSTAVPFILAFVSDFLFDILQVIFRIELDIGYCDTEAPMFQKINGKKGPKRLHDCI